MPPSETTSLPPLDTVVLRALPKAEIVSVLPDRTVALMILPPEETMAWPPALSTVPTPEAASDMVCELALPTTTVPLATAK